MKAHLSISLALGLLGLAMTSMLHASVQIDVGTTFVREGDTAAQIVIPVTGGGLVTDMAAIVQIGDGGPLVGGTPGPLVAAVNYTGSIWESAPGGYDAFLTAPLPSQIVDPGVSLKVAGQTVNTTGILFTLVVDVSGFSPGDYPLLLTGTVAGNTAFMNGGQSVTPSILNGVIRVLTPLDYWRWQNFPDTWQNPALEATVWGNHADPDRDGLPNLMEFYIGTDPNTPTFNPATSTQPGRPAFTFIEDGGQRFPALAYTRRKEIGAVSAEPQSSTTLSAWSNAGFLPVGSPVTLPDTLLEYIVVRLNQPVAPPPASRFLRLAVTPP